MSGRGRRRWGEGELIVMGLKGMNTSCTSFNGKAKVLSEKKRLERHQGSSNLKKFEKSKKNRVENYIPGKNPFNKKRKRATVLVNQLGT
jgi:hypothetical protein